MTQLEPDVVRTWQDLVRTVLAVTWDLSLS